MEALSHMSSVSLGISSVKKGTQKSKSHRNAPDKKFTEDKSAAFHDHQDDRGHWASKVEPVNLQKFYCEPCNFEAPYEWKLKRHKGTVAIASKTRSCLHTKMSKVSNVSKVSKVSSCYPFLMSSWPLAKCHSLTHSLTDMCNSTDAIASKNNDFI